MCLFLAALGVSIYFVYNTIIDYLNFNVTTEVRLINVDELDFPIITICDGFQYSNKIGFNYLYLKINQSNLTYFKGDHNHSYFQLITKYQPYEIYHQIPIELRQNYSPSIQEMFLGASLHGEEDKNEITINDFFWIFNPYFGNCYQLNTDLKLKANSYEKNVLKLNLDFDFVEDENGYFDCPSSFDRKYYDQIKSAGYQYSQSLCISFCQLDKIGVL